MQLIGEIKELHNPYYSKLSVERVYPIIKQHEILLKFLPDYPENEFTNRSFFYGIVSTLFQMNWQN